MSTAGHDVPLRWIDDAPRAQRRAPALIAIAIALLCPATFAGFFVVGHRHASSTQAAAAEQTRTAYGASVLLEYPASWRRVSTRLAPAIPGLKIAGAVLLSPGGKGVRAGLLSGQIPGRGASPLPSALLARLRRAPHTEVVDLLDAQAYRYSHLILPGYRRILDLYVIPGPGASDAALACYVSKPLAGYLQRCEQIVAGLTLVGGRSPADLSPEAGYAARLGRLIEKLDAKRLKLRASMRPGVTPATMSHLAATLAERFAAAARSLSVLEPPLPAGQTQAALASAIVRAQSAYEALAAALADSQSDYATARAGVEGAEHDIDAALRNFALLGYRPG